MINRSINFRSIILLSIDESERNYLYLLLSLNTIVTFACFFFFFFNQIHDLSRINNRRDSKMSIERIRGINRVKRKKKKKRARERVCDDRLRKQNNRIGKRGMRHSIPRSCQVKSQGQGHHDSGQSSSFLFAPFFFSPRLLNSLLTDHKISIRICTRYLGSITIMIDRNDPIFSER